MSTECAMGVRLRWDQQGRADRRLWVMDGDGAIDNIDFQSLSRPLMSGKDIKVLALRTPVKKEHRRELSLIAMMHPHVFVAQTTPAHVNHFYKSVMEANAFPGPAIVICYAASMPEHGTADDRAMAQAKLAVESRAFPLMIYDPRKGETIRERLSLQGNLSVNEDWFANPKTGALLDFVAFVRTEGRFARHFDAAGKADEFLLSAQGDRLENWRKLQELAGLRN